MPQVSALMSVYNGERFINETINSILNQTYEDFELLIVDDASTDNTVEVINAFNDKRIKLIQLEQNVGVGHALRIGVEHINSKYVIKVDSDDLNHPERFELQKQYLDEHPDISLVKTLISFFPENEEVQTSNRFRYLKDIKEKCFNSVITREDISKYINYWCCIPHYSIAIRTEVLKKVNYEDLRFGEDYTLFYNLNKIGVKMDTITKVLVKCRARIDSLTASSEGNINTFNYIYNLKRSDIEKFVSNSKEMYIWGTGTLAKALHNNLIKDGIRILGFIDGRLSNGEMSDFLDYAVYSKDILANSKKKVFLAANPALFLAMDFFDSISYKLGKDYYIYN